MGKVLQLVIFLIAASYASFQYVGFESSDWNILYTLAAPLLLIAAVLAFLGRDKTPAAEG